MVDRGSVGPRKLKEGIRTSSQTLIVTRCYESSVLVAECDGVDRTQMVIIFLHRLLSIRPYIKLHNLLVTHTRQELMRHARIPPHHMRRRARAESRNASTCLSIPLLHLAIETARQEVCPRRRKVNVCDGFGVARVGAEEGA